MVRGLTLKSTVTVLALLIFSACSPIFMSPGASLQTPKIDDINQQIIMTDGLAMPFHSWPIDGVQQPEAIVLALHGFNDYGAFISGLAGYLNDQDIAVYAYDQRGFGASANVGFWAGQDAYLKDAKTAFALIRSRHPGVPLYGFGESMGGAVLLAAASHPDTHPLDVDGLILSAPAVWGRDTMPWYQRSLLWLMAHTAPQIKLSGRGLDIKPSDNIEMLRALSRDPLIIKNTRVDTIWGLTNLMDQALDSAATFETRALILYGEHDEVIEKGPTEMMIKRLPRKQKDQILIATYKDGYHMLTRDLGAEIVWQDILSWIKQPTLKKLPSDGQRRGIAFFNNDQ